MSLRLLTVAVPCLAMEAVKPEFGDSSLRRRGFFPAAINSWKIVPHAVLFFGFSEGLPKKAILRAYFSNPFSLSRRI